MKESWESWDSPAIGIDLGTRFSCVAVWQRGQAEIIVNDQGNRKTPCCVAFTESEILIGEAAKNQSSTNPANTIFDVKNLIGRRYSDLAVENDIMSWPFKVIGDGNDKPKIVVSYKGKKQQFTVEKICSMVLMKMKQTAEAYLCAEVKHAVITVPAYFNDIQRQATKDAGIMAGLNTVRIISESTAATVAYGFCKQPSDCWGSNVLIFDMGGANLDVSFLTINEGTVEFKAISGHSQFGGDDLDENLASFLRTNRHRTCGHDDYSENSKNLLASCERAKRILSNSFEATVYQDNGFCLIISRAQFEFINDGFFKECMQVAKKCLRNAKIDETDVHYVVLVGGPTRIPKVQQMLQKFFCHGTKLLNSINVEEVVAYGAASYAAMLSRRVYVSPTYPFTELHIGVSLEESFLVPCSKMTRTVKSWVQESSPSLILKDIDSLLEDLTGSKNFRKSSTTFCSLKTRLLKLLEEVRCKPNDVQLTRQVSQSLTNLSPYLPNHLLTVIKSIEEDLLASQQQYLEWSSKEAAISLNVEETDTIQSHLVKFKTDILEMTSSRDHLRSKITGIDKEIATLMDHKSQIEEKLSSVEKDLHKLIRSVDLQVDLARRQSAILAQRREASNFKDKAQLSIEATLNSFASYFKNL